MNVVNNKQVRVRGHVRVCAFMYKTVCETNAHERVTALTTGNSIQGSAIRLCEAKGARSAFLMLLVDAGTGLSVLQRKLR